MPSDHALDKMYLSCADEIGINIQYFILLENYWLYISIDLQKSSLPSNELELLACNRSQKIKKKKCAEVYVTRKMLAQVFLSYTY